MNTKDLGGIKQRWTKEEKTEMLFPPWIFPRLLADPPLSRKKDKHTILLVQTKDGSFLNSLCAKKSLGYPLPFCKQSKTGLEKLGLTSRTLDVPKSVTKITQTQFCHTQSSTSVDICMWHAFMSSHVKSPLFTDCFKENKDKMIQTQLNSALKQL